MVKIDSNWLFWEYDADGNVVDEFPITKLFTTIALDSPYIAWQLTSLGTDITIDETTGDVTAVKGDGTTWTISH